MNAGWGAGVIAAAGLAACAASAGAQDYTLRIIQRPSDLSVWYPTVVSRNGQVVAGEAHTTSGSYVRFIATLHPDSSPTVRLVTDAVPNDGYNVGVSNDGRTLLVKDANDADGYLWRELHGWTTLRDFEGGDNLQVYALAGHGRTVVGWARRDAPSIRAAAWIDGSASPSALPALADDACASIAVDISSDGSVIVGGSSTRPCGTSGNLSRAVRWVDGSLTEPGVLPGHDSSGAVAVSSNGLHVAGFSHTVDFDDERIFLWSAGIGMRDLGPREPPGQLRLPLHIAPDGRTVLLATTPVGSNPAADLVWHDGTFTPLRDYLEQATGADLAAWQHIGALHADSDGVIIGRARLGDGHTYLWILEDACPADFDGDGVADIGDFAAFRAAFLSGDLRADYNGNGTLEPNDFTAFRVAFLSGCS